jgi:hypothetical protein
MRMKAFPTLKDNGHITTQDGMDLRDYFAAQAMQGICVSKDEAGTLVNHGYEWIASESYKIADAMMEARKDD